MPALSEVEDVAASSISIAGWIGVECTNRLHSDRCFRLAWLAKFRRQFEKDGNNATKIRLKYLEVF